jgi:hypothetical protein
MYLDCFFYVKHIVTNGDKVHASKVLKNMGLWMALQNKVSLGFQTGFGRIDTQ